MLWFSGSTFQEVARVAIRSDCWNWKYLDPRIHSEWKQNWIVRNTIRKLLPQLHFGLHGLSQKSRMVWPADSKTAGKWGWRGISVAWSLANVAQDKASITSEHLLLLHCHCANCSQYTTSVKGETWRVRSVYRWNPQTDGGATPRARILLFVR